MRKFSYKRIISIILVGALCLEMLPSTLVNAEEAVVSPEYIATESVLEPTEGNVSEPTEETISETIEETVLEPTEESVPEPTEGNVSEPTEEAIPETTEETVLEPTEESVPESTEETIPESTEETVPEPTEETIPEPTEETVPELTEETIPEITDETVTETMPENFEALSGTGTDPWEIIDACGGLQEPYAFGPDIVYELPQSFNDENVAEVYAVREYSIESLVLLKELLNSYSSNQTLIKWSENGNTLTSMPLDAGEQLILLSVTDPQVYQSTEFQSGSVTGAISLTGSVSIPDSSQLTFQGLGSVDVPFQGSFVNSSFTVNRTLFNALNYSNDSFQNDSLTIEWNGEESVGAIAALSLTSTATQPLTVTINSSRHLFRDAAFGEITGNLDLNISFSSGIAFENKSSSNNAGLVVNTMKDGTLTLAVTTFPSSITIGIENAEETKNNAGLLVGYLDNASLTLNSAMTMPVATIQAPLGGAGGIVGRVGRTDSANTKITLNDNVNLTNATIVGNYTGGIAGYAKNVEYVFNDKQVILPVSLGVKAGKVVGSGYANSQYTGGIFGWYDCGNELAYSSFDGNGFSFPTEPITLHVNVASGEAGVLFGHLILGHGFSFNVAGTLESPLNISSKIVVADTTVQSAGGLVGALVGASKADELIVGANVTVSVADVTKDKIKYLGGLAGNVEKATVSVKDVTVTVPQPSATTCFGGLVASLGDDCVLKTTETVKISTTAANAKNATAIVKGGGLVGEAKSGSVVQLKGITDLSAVAYTAPTSTSVSVGQLVGAQDSALIFATGSGNSDSWTYQRSTSQARVDDIGNYGQVIRLGDKLDETLISLDTYNQVRFLKGYTETYGIIDSANDFALHAIAFTTNNKFELYNSISSDMIKKTSVTLTDDIDLSGTGIQGLTRDNGSDQWDGSTNGTGNGVTFDGGTKNLTINTGEIYGKRGDVAASGEGSGQCYRHGYYGLMGKVNSAIVKDLTVKSTMNIGTDINTYAGTIFGWVNGGHLKNGSVNTVNNVTLTNDSEINLDGTPPKDNFSHVGGFIGYVAGEETGVTVKDSSMQGGITYTGTSDSVILGGILGKDNYSTSINLQFENVTVKTAISTSTTGNAHVGGLVADICANSNTNRNNNGAKMSLKNVVIASRITSAAKTTSGGLLGYYWDNVDVTFDGSAENPYAVTTYIDDTQASLSASDAAVGGLCFAATGRWNMQGKAVDMGSASINNGSGTLGLLVCHGERQGGTPGVYTDGEKAKALYLVMDTEWDTAYKNSDVTISGSPAIFDEIVAYTARSNKATTNPVYDITRNDAGIISLHTIGDKVNMTSGDRNTYFNRTAYGTNKQANPYSRYYYNLDGMSSLTLEGNVDTPEELLVWSVRKYCTENICSYLPIIISNTIAGTLDMDGYSYYPVTVANTDMKVQNATIIFHNDDIEKLESDNKSTLDTNGRTQHFTMHSGLLNDYYTDKDAQKSATLTVNDLTLLGTVGMVGNGSGALICGKIYGYDGTKSVKLEMDTLKVDREDTHLLVASYNTTYAPLLINSAGSYVALNITGVTVTKTESAGATSLIGNVGDAQAMGITLTLSAMKLPDMDGRFTKATMLHSFRYAQNSSAVYNFTKDEDWSGTVHSYQVTYGKEIGGTVEYAASGSNPGQHLYARSTENVSHSGKKFTGDDRDRFSSYLPYVFRGYNETEGYHEIQVNGSMKDISSGCGTYGDPYQISDEQELVSIANYLATNNASKGWTLHIAVPESGTGSPFCSGTGEEIVHKTFVYDGSETGKEWVEQVADTPSAESVTLSNDTVLTYLRNAYYQIIDNITVNSFTGFGTQANPFRGVIVGETGNETITLTGTLPQGFIVYSYGSVVKNVKFQIGTGMDSSVKGTRTVSFAEIKNNQGYTSESFFGGVIGCILGGDNIIDGVNVIYPSIPPVSLTEKDSNDRKKDHLIPVGGYVGVISGGGVIFRGNNGKTNEACEKVTDTNYFYANPYVGRVLQGFAVQEKKTNEAELNNSNKNYQICQLDFTKTGDKASISVASNSITLSDAQALLVFSSVTNSGGAGDGKVLPYFKDAQTVWNNEAFSATSVGGKVRNAVYSEVGNATAETADYKKSQSDDFTVFGQGNTSYLDTHYAGGALFKVCNTTNTGYTLNLSGVRYDMTIYGNGYRSISPRYLANAVCSSATNSTVGSNYQYLNPLISEFNGNGATIKTNIVSKEYVDDDHHAIAVGGIFNTLRFMTGATMLNVTIGGTEGAGNGGTISHEYYEWTNGNCEDATHKNWNGAQGFTNLLYEQGRGLIAIGGFAGNNVMNFGEKTITFKSINTKFLKIKGPFDAGGIIGHTGVRVTSDYASNTATNQSDPNSVNYRICYLIDVNNSLVQPTFHNCSYSNLTIEGGMMVGGYMGFVANNQYYPMGSGSHDKTVSIQFDQESDGKLGVDSSIVCKRPKTDDGIDNAKAIGSTSKITCLPAVGGLLGRSNLAVTIDNERIATIENVEVRSSRSAGGVVAWPFSSVTVRNLSIIGNVKEPNQIGDLLKYGEGDKTKQSNNNVICEFSGGMIGYFEGGGKSIIVENCTVENLVIVASWRSSSYPGYAGGIVGDLNSGASATYLISNCKLKNLQFANDNYNKTGYKDSFEGGLVGRIEKGFLYGNNLLVDSIQFTILKSTDLVGDLLGRAESATIVYLAGVSIQNTKNLPTILQEDIGGTTPAKCYVAYADYTGAAQKVETSTESPASSNSEKNGSVVANSSAPHVTTSPRGVEIPTGPKNDEEIQEKMYLYGDGANPDIVKTISGQNGNSGSDRFYYSAASGCKFDSKYSSTFYAEMGLTKDTANGIPDFPVLQVPVAEKEIVSKQIVDYLDLITNNGYSTARTESVGASEHIGFSIDLYRWNEAGYFEKNPPGVAKAFSGSGASFETSFTNYDSGKNQFELLTVTFTKPNDIPGLTSFQYKIQVPIVVRRMLEVDFTATLKDSPSFKVNDYEDYNADGFKQNITVGYGVSVSALLTYTYNCAIGEAQKFGWQAYLDNGGFMGDPEQTIQFYNPNSKLKSLPKGTQLILLDCANNNRVYHYAVATQSESEGTRVKLSEFLDSQENPAPYSSQWLSEIMGVTAEGNDDGKWVLLRDGDKTVFLPNEPIPEGATARVKMDTGYQYFRPKTKDDTDTTKLYNLTAAEGDSGGEIQPTEQFYLIIYIPDSSVEDIPITSETEGKNLNGYISATLPGLNEKIACNINAVRVKRDGSVVPDPHSSSESTYNFLSGYVQSLADNSSDKANKQETDPEAYILLDQPQTDGNYLLHMDLVDEITVVKGQKDTEDKPLFFKVDISLPSYVEADNSAVSLVTANGFPTGCYGTAEFYVYLQDDQGNKTYYKWNDNSWNPATSGEKALSYEWNADGGNMKLYLGTANTPNVSLAAIRQLAKNDNEKFYVETKMDIHMSVPAAEQVIAGSITKGKAFTKLSYTTYLDSSTADFSSTNYVESKQGEVRYYQSRSGSSTLTHSANDPTQLGINCSDLASANGVIFTTGVYDLTTVSNAENLIKDANKVTYTLSLWQRQENGGYEQITKDLSKYIRNVRINDNLVSYLDGYHWTDTKSDEKFASIDPENGKRFLVPIRVQVDTDVETNDVTFANYQLRLTATLYKDNEVLDQPVNKEIQNGGTTEYIRYDYVTYTITRLLTDGYWETESSNP